MTRYIFIAIAIGAAILAYSFTLQPYTDEGEFRSRTREMSTDQNDDFYTLRDEMVTSKFRLQDTGITIIAFSLLLLVLLRLGRGEVMTPGSKLNFLFLAAALPFLTVFGFIFDLVQGLGRDEFPPWADSIGIPLMGVPFEFITLLAWSLLHLVFLIGIETSSVSLRGAVSIKLNPWLIFVSVITLLFTLLTVFYGQYWYAVPGAAWVYYYLSLGAVRRVAISAQESKSLV